MMEAHAQVIFDLVHDSDEGFINVDRIEEEIDRG